MCAVEPPPGEASAGVLWVCWMMAAEAGLRWVIWRVGVGEAVPLWANCDSLWCCVSVGCFDMERLTECEVKDD